MISSLYHHPGLFVRTWDTLMLGSRFPNNSYRDDAFGTMTCILDCQAFEMLHKFFQESFWELSLNQNRFDASVRTIEGSVDLDWYNIVCFVFPIFFLFIFSLHSSFKRIVIISLSCLVAILLCICLYFLYSSINYSRNKVIFSEIHYFIV